MLIIKSADFVVSAPNPSHYPQNLLPEIALVGRSNVGKSSMINTLINRKGLAKTSSTPGKTQLLNFYLINKEFYFVDLPGYGFARVAKSVKSEWGKMIETYLQARENLIGVIQLVDSRHEPSKDDIIMQEWLQHLGLPTFVVATKIDKISRGNWPKHEKIVKTKLGLKEQPLILFSAENRQGKEQILEQLAAWIKVEEKEGS